MFRSAFWIKYALFILAKYSAFPCSHKFTEVVESNIKYKNKSVHKYIE